MKYIFTAWESESTKGLEEMVNGFLSQGAMEIISMSYSTVWDVEKKYVLYSVGIVHKVIE